MEILDQKFDKLDFPEFKIIEVYGYDKYIEKLIEITKSNLIIKIIYSNVYKFKIEIKSIYEYLFINETSQIFSFIVNDLVSEECVKSIFPILSYILKRDLNIDSDDYFFFNFMINTRKYYSRIFLINDGENIYLSKEELNIMNLKIDKFLGKTLISDNPMTSFYINQMENFPYLEKIDNLYFYDNKLKDIMERKQIDILVKNINYSNLNAMENGFYKLKYNDVEIGKEISELFSLDLYEDNDNSYIKSPRLVGCELYDWIEKTILKIKTNKTPITRIYGNWQLSEDDYTRNIIKIYYSSYFSYSTIVNDQPKNFYKKIKVLSDYSILVPIFSDQQYVKFLSSLYENYSTLDQNFIFLEFDNVKEAIEYRSYLINSNTKSYPLIITFRDRIFVASNNYSFIYESFEIDYLNYYNYSGLERLFDYTTEYKKYPGKIIKTKNIWSIEYIKDEEIITKDIIYVKKYKNIENQIQLNEIIK